MDIQEVLFIHDKVTYLGEMGDYLFLKKDYKGSLEKFKEAIELIPEPREEWSDSEWIYFGIGQVYFTMEDYENSLKNYYESSRCGDREIDPCFIDLHIGRCLYELNRMDEAKEYLGRVYSLEGESYFKNIDEKYLEFAKEKNDFLDG